MTADCCATNQGWLILEAKDQKLQRVVGKTTLGIYGRTALPTLVLSVPGVFERGSQTSLDDDLWNKPFIPTYLVKVASYLQL